MPRTSTSAPTASRPASRLRARLPRARRDPPRASASQRASVTSGSASRLEPGVHQANLRSEPWIRCGDGGHEDDRDPDRDPGASLAGAARARAPRDRAPADRAPADLRRAGGERDDHGRRRQRVRRLRRRRRRGQRRARAPAGSSRRSSSRRRASCTPTSRSSRTSPGSRSRSDSARSRRSRGDASRVLQRGHGGGRERGQARAPAHGTARGDRVRGRLPRADPPLDDDDVEVPSVQDGMGPYAPEVTARPTRTRTAGRAPPRRSSGSSTCSRPTCRRARRGDRDRAAARRRRVRPRVARVHGRASCAVRPARIVLVADEVQTGFGRTGRMFAMEHFGVEPDLIVGREVDRGRAAALGRDRAGGDHGRRARGAIGGTYIGNPVAQAAALAVLDVFEEEGLLERAGLVGDRIRERMLAWQGAGPRSATSAGSGRCSRSSSSTTRRRRTRRRSWRWR